MSEDARKYASELRDIAGMVAQTEDGPLRWKQYRLAAIADYLSAYQSEAPAQGEGRAEAIALDVAETITAHMRSPDMIWGLGGIDPELLDEMEAELRSITVAALTNALATISKTETVALPLADREAIAEALWNVGERDRHNMSWERAKAENHNWVEGCYMHADAVVALSGSLPPSPVGEGMHPLARMVALDEELEAEHPGWMTGVPEADGEGITTPAPVRGE